MNSIMEEVKILVKKRSKKIILLGQNVNARKSKSKYGNEWSFGNLIEEIAKFDKIFSIRYTTSHPLDMDIELLKAHKNIKSLCLIFICQYNRFKFHAKKNE